MAKSFRRALACLLAVLMVAFSVPFTALADYIDDFDPNVVSTYHPDVDIQFSTIYNGNDGLWNDKGTASADAEFGYCGVYDVPLTATYTKDTTNGAINISSLTLDAAKEAEMADYYNSIGVEVTPYDYTYASGDIFLATVVLRNVTDIKGAYLGISYGGNIEPAGIFNFRHGARGGQLYGYTWGGLSDLAAAEVGKTNPREETWIGGINPITKQCSDVIYGENINSTEDSIIDSTNHYMLVATVTGDGANATLCPHDNPDVPFVDPVTGAAEGYTYTDTIILASFAFKITGAVNAQNPITFGVYDPTNTLDETESYSYGKYSCLETNARSCATYAAHSTSAASEQMTFFGMNINSGEGCGGGTHTHDYTWVVTTPAVAATCTTAGATAIETGTCSCGDTQTRGGDVIPALGHDLGEWVVTTPAVAATCTTAGATAIETKSCSRCDYTETQGGDTVAALGHDYVGVVTAPTCTDAGYTTYTCSRCGDSYTGDNVAALGHDFGEWAVVTEATEEHNGLKRRECSRCDAYEEEVIPALEHTHVAGEAAQENVVPATCTEAGSYDLVVRCTKCNEIMESTPQTIPALGHDLSEWTVTTPAVAATCTEAGTTAVETKTCSRCDYTETQGGEVIPALGHDLGEWTVTTPAVAATCTEAGATAVETKTCSRCDYTETQGGDTVAALGHDWGAWVETKAATVSTPAEETRTCGRCGATETQTTESLDITITVEEVEGGTVSGDITYGNPGIYKFGDSYSVTATAAEGYAFKGWKINGKSVSTEETYDGKAFNDITITPIFAKTAASSFTVIFYDLYKTVVKTQTVTSAAEIEAPTDAQMARQGYTFKGWNIDPASVTESAEIIGQYDVNDSLMCTVTVSGTDAAKINGNDATSADVAYDTQVTVSAEGATAWKIGETVVATGPTYSFYVGADVTVTAVFDDVEMVPTIIMTSEPARIDNTYRLLFVASRVVPAGYNVEKVGFIYGKNLTDAELVLDKAGQNSAAGTTIKVGYNEINSVKETTLQYGIKSESGTPKARAFMVVSKGGKSEVLYSQIASYNYATNKGTLTNISTTIGEDD